MAFGRAVVAMAVGAAALGAVAWGGQEIPAVPLAVYGNVAVAGAVFFDADACAQVAGWYWVRPECRQYVDWVFTGLDPRTVSSEDPYVYVNLGALVTNGVNGGSGWSTQVGLEVWVVGQLEDVIGKAEPSGRRLLDRSSVTLENAFRPRMEADTQGVGYQAWADASRVSAEDLAKYTAVHGPLVVVRLIRLGAAKGQPEHVAVNASSVTLSYRIAR